MSLPADFVRQERNVAIRLVAGSGHTDAVISAIAGAKSSVWIATANLKQLMIAIPGVLPGVGRKGRGQNNFDSVLVLFERLIARGVEIRLLHASPPSRPLAADLKRRTGLATPPRGITGRFEMRMCPRVHLKTVIVDGQSAYMGSANFTGAGLGAKNEDRRNFELGIITTDDLMLDELQSLFDFAWRGASCKTCRLHAECPMPIDPSIKRAASPGAPSPARAGRRKPRPKSPVER
jgi:phosphatidylserine/phosphatidylglycerophosphate/cardiolipin synthase-like enzyme